MSKRRERRRDKAEIHEKADDCTDAGVRATQDAKADAYRDVGGRATQEAKAECTRQYMSILSGFLTQYRRAQQF